MATDPTFTTSDDRRRLEAQVTFNADAPLTLSASNASGRVDVTTDATLPAGTVHVAAIRTDNGEFEEGDHHLAVKVEGNSISIHPDWQFASGVSGLARRIRDQLQYGFRPEDWNLSRLRLSPELDFHIIVRLPANLADGSQIKLRTASGEVDARNFQAGASIITASGDVEARDLIGTISIHTASGDVEASNIVESLEINTASGDVSIAGGDAWLAARSASGDVDIRDFALRNARVTTVSGDVQIRATISNSAAGYGIETVSGDVSLDAALPGHGARATLGFGTLSGSSDVGAAWDKQKRREWTAGAGASGPSINVKTVSGDLSARARLDDSVEARELAMPRREDDADQADMPSGDDFVDFKEEMKQFGKEMKQFGKEFRHIVGTGPTPPTPPAPPAPPRGPHGQHERDAEQRRRDEEQRMRDLEQQHRDLEQQRRDLEQANEARIREQHPDQPRESAAEPDSSLFTAGPSGVDYRRDTTPLTPQTSAPPAQPTEPVEPAQPFTEEPTMDQQDATSPEPTGTPTSEAAPTDDRLRVLEALEKGEIDIEDALAQLDRDSGNA
jgi:hypothetical protein